MQKVTSVEKIEEKPKEQLVVLKENFVIAEYNRHLLCNRFVNEIEFYESFKNELAKVELQDKNLPFDVEICNAKWFGPFDEMRKRLKIAMNQHFYKDIIMLVGLDYMGAYANVQLHLMQLVEEEPPLRKPVKEDPSCPEGCRPSFMGPSPEEKRYQEAVQKYNDELRSRERAKDVHRLVESYRAFKNDDFRIFCTIVQQITGRVIQELFKEAEMKREYIGGKEKDVFALLQ